MLQSMGLQRVKHDWVTELNWAGLKNPEALGFLSKGPEAWSKRILRVSRKPLVVHIKDSLESDSQRIPSHLIWHRTFSSVIVWCTEDREVRWSPVFRQGFPIPTHFMSAQKEPEVWWECWLQSYLFTTDNEKVDLPQFREVGRGVLGSACQPLGLQLFPDNPFQQGLIN